MTTIDPNHRIATVLRHEVAVLRRPAGRAAAKPAAGSGSIPPAVAERIAAIPAADPDRKRKAVRVFLESVLLRELGGRLLHDADFPVMVDAVQKYMQEDAELARAVDRLGDLLLSA